MAKKEVKKEEEVKAEEVCANCAGRGRLYESDTCEVCGGTGLPV